MIDTNKYAEDVDETYNLIMNVMNDEDREYHLKSRIRYSNEMTAAIVTLDAEVKRLRPMADELIAIWDILAEDYPHVDRAIVKELVERKIGDYRLEECNLSEVIE